MAKVYANETPLATVKVVETVGMVVQVCADAKQRNSVNTFIKFEY